MAITGIPSLRASLTAMCSFLVSTTHNALGTRDMSLIPPSDRSSLSRSRRSWSSSFLVMPEPATSSKSISSSSLSRCSRLKTVVKLVSMPPSHRWFTNGMPTLRACSATASWACFLVPTYRTVPPWATVSLMNSYAWSMKSSDCCRSMM